MSIDCRLHRIVAAQPYPLEEAELPQHAGLSQQHQHRQRGADLAEVTVTAHDASGAKSGACEPESFVVAEDRLSARPALSPAT